MNASQRTPREVVESYLAATGAADFNAVADLFSEDSVIEMPFGSIPGQTYRFEGREGHRSRLGGFAPSIEVHGVDLVTLLQTEDPEVVVVEYEYRATVRATGKPFVNRYVSLVRVRDGEIVLSRDFANPLVSAKSFDRLRPLLESLVEEAEKEQAKEAEAAG